MAPKFLPIAVSIAVLGALYQVIIRDVLFVVIGIDRKTQRIEEFPFRCRRLMHPLLESCEDLVLDAVGRKVYAACSTIESRMGWAPNGDSFNASARALSDHISVLSLDTPDPTGSYSLTTLSFPTPFKTSTGDFDIDVLGLELEVLSETRLRFYIIKARPPLPPLDAAIVGANSSIEVFDLTRGETELEFVKSLTSDALVTPNNLAATGDRGLVVTNDHNVKVGIARHLEILSGGGFLTHCPSPTTCHKISSPSTKFSYPNGIVRDPTSNLYYVANSALGSIFVFSMNKTTKELEKVDEIYIGMPLDNLSIDENGDVFVVGFPKIWELMYARARPRERDVGSGVWRIRMTKGGEGGSGLRWEKEKVLEDKKGKFVSGATVAVHDVRRGTFFFGGIMAPLLVFVSESRNESDLGGEERWWYNTIRMAYLYSFSRG